MLKDYKIPDRYFDDAHYKQHWKVTEGSNELPAQGSNQLGTDSDRKSNICSEDFTVIRHVCQVIMTRKETGCGTTEIAR